MKRRLNLRKMIPQEIRPYVKEAIKQGCEAYYDGRGHVRIKFPETFNCTPVSMASTSSDPRNIKNLIAAFRRRGIEVELKHSRRRRPTIAEET